MFLKPFTLKSVPIIADILKVNQLLSNLIPAEISNININNILIYDKIVFLSERFNNPRKLEIVSLLTMVSRLFRVFRKVKADPNVKDSAIADNIIIVNSIISCLLCFVVNCLNISIRIFFNGTFTIFLNYSMASYFDK